jgi:type IV secretion system protein TrbL
VLAVIVGIGAGFFNDFITALQGQEPNLAQAMSLVLASITLFGLGIFGPGIATGLVSGAPQLGAGAAIGTAGALAAAGLATGGAAAGLARGGFAAVQAATSVGSGASTAYGLAQATSGAQGISGVGAGLAGVARAGAGAAADAARSFGQRATTPLIESAATGRQAAWRATGGGGTPAGQSASASAANGSVPQWAQQLRAEQRFRARRHATTQAIRDGDRAGAAANPDLAEREH